MPALDSKLRSQLDDVCQKAREKAEEAARSALQKRAVDAAEPHAHFTPAEKELRNRLRARGRQAGDVRQANKTQGIEQLIQELAYEYWHRMLFARLLAENHLLMHPDGVAVSLEECEELARVGQPFQADIPSSDVRLESLTYNGFVLAARYASKMLPQVFRTDDVLLEVEFAPEHRLALEKLLASLPRETFLADDSLGWVYQFWQSKRKDEVNKSGDKIDGRTLPAVTQLFTEDYMVQFLLHNTIGAWWCARHSVGQAFQPDKVARVRLESLTYLRWRDDGTPAAGTFDGWPKTLNEFKLLDPCCGSGHFLVAAFNLLVPLRMHDEGLTAKEACDAVLRENLFGLELDPRCTQIAAFALAVAAWKYPGEDGQSLGYRELPPLNIACTGIGPQATEDEWLKLAEQSGKPMSVLSREPILNGLGNLHALFSNAPTLGSLIDPKQLSADLITADYETLQPYLAAALTAEQADDDAHERAIAAAGMVKAAELLAGEYTLVATNVPYLGRGKQDHPLSKHLEKHYSDGKADLATAFVLRCLEFCAQGGTAALVTPQNWLFLTRYTRFRVSLLKHYAWNLVVRLGEHAFENTAAAGAFATMLVFSAKSPGGDHTMVGIDASATRGQRPIYAEEKAAILRGSLPADVAVVLQAGQLKNPEAKIAFERVRTATMLSDHAAAPRGLVSGDRDYWVRMFWEQPRVGSRWRPLQSAVQQTAHYSGRETVIDWATSGKGMLRPGLGNTSYGKYGIAVAQVGRLPCTLYTGELYDNSTFAIVPTDPTQVLAIWAFCSSAEYNVSVRKFNRKLSVDPSHLVQVPFDLAHWQAVAAEKYPNGLPEPESDDPTQWLFHGRPEASTAPLQVAVARLLGYRWPAELDAEMRLSARARELVRRCDELREFADNDGIVCIPAVRTKLPAHERLAELLQAVGQAFQPDVGRQAGKPDLQDWLRNAFFEQHCKLFHNRPFIWQIWDGRKDGFSCLVNYHKLDYQALDNVTHSYLESWIKKQAGDAKTSKVGADLRLAAAQALQKKLELILAGEPPYDIFVRWKPLHEQAIGWNPDLNDGVRMNIRPFVEAGVLRKNPNTKWTKDRGKEPERDKDDYPWFWKGKTFTGDRVNDVHLTNAEKRK